MTASIRGGRGPAAEAPAPADPVPDRSPTSRAPGVRESLPVALVESALQVIDAHDDSAKAFIEVYRDDADEQRRAAAKESRGRAPRGPSTAFRSAGKDKITSRPDGRRWARRSTRTSSRTSTPGAYTRLNEARGRHGQRTNMHEYALGGTTDNLHRGTCREPVDRDRRRRPDRVVAPRSRWRPEWRWPLSGRTPRVRIRIPAADRGSSAPSSTYGRLSRFGASPGGVGSRPRGPDEPGRYATRRWGAGRSAAHDPCDPGSLDVWLMRSADSLRDSCEGMSSGVEEGPRVQRHRRRHRGLGPGRPACSGTGGRRPRTVAVPDCEHRTRPDDHRTPPKDEHGALRRNLRDRPSRTTATKMSGFCRSSASFSSARRAPPGTARSADAQTGRPGDLPGGRRPGRARRWAVVHIRSERNSRSSTTSRWSPSTA